MGCRRFRWPSHYFSQSFWTVIFWLNGLHQCFHLFFHDKVSDSVRFDAASVCSKPLVGWCWQLDGVHLGPSCHHSFTRSPISTLGHQVLNSSHYKIAGLNPPTVTNPIWNWWWWSWWSCFAWWRWASWSDQRRRFPGTDWRFFFGIWSPCTFSCEHFPALSRCTVKLPAMLPVMTWDR